MLVAVLYRHGGINLLANDLYISTIAGGQAREPGCDLAIVAALASAAKSKPIPRTTCAIGEISLTGQVRPVPRLEYRLREADGSACCRHGGTPASDDTQTLVWSMYLFSGTNGNLLSGF